MKIRLIIYGEKYSVGGWQTSAGAALTKLLKSIYFPTS